MERTCPPSSRASPSPCTPAFGKTSEVRESRDRHSVVIDHFPFEVREQGWGEFEVEVKVEFKNDAELPVTFTHFLKLHPFNGEPSKENVVGDWTAE